MRKTIIIITFMFLINLTIVFAQTQFPIENAVTLVGMVALFLIILQILFKTLPSRDVRK